MPSYHPIGPLNEKDLLSASMGGPMFPLFPGSVFGGLIPGTNNTFNYNITNVASPASGILTSTGTAVNNITTATPFAQGTLQNDGFTRTLQNTMAGRAYWLNAVAAGTLMVSDSPLINDNRYWTVALNTTVPPAAFTFPGIPMNAGDVRQVKMPSTCGWLQWISTTGTASLICVEAF
jgi:hypothetical protein